MDRLGEIAALAVGGYLALCAVLLLLMGALYVLMGSESAERVMEEHGKRMAGVCAVAVAVFVAVDVGRHGM